MTLYVHICIIVDSNKQKQCNDGGWG